MENIDMEAIARKFGIWRWQDRKCPNCNEDYSAVFKSNYCIMYGCGAELLPAINVPPNFRDPEWLVRLKNELSERGYVWEFGIIGGVVLCFIKHHIRQEEKYAEQAINWIDAFLLAAAKLAKEV